MAIIIIIINRAALTTHELEWLEPWDKLAEARAEMFKSWARLCWEHKRNTVHLTHIINIHNCLSLSCLLWKLLPETRYLSWWHMADLDQSLMRICENLVKIICRASKLKCDDPSLKGALASFKTCELCDQLFFNAPEDIFHILMQCPYFLRTKNGYVWENLSVTTKSQGDIREWSPQSISLANG